MSAIHNAWFGESGKDGDGAGEFFNDGQKNDFGGDPAHSAVRFFSSWLLLNTEARRVGTDAARCNHWRNRVANQTKLELQN